MSGIRLRYAGLASFTIRILSIFTGLLFAVIVTRRLDVADFGLWQLISVTVGYGIFPTTIINFWITRDMARGKAIARTGLFATSLLSIGGVAIYLAISKGISLGLDPGTFFFFLLATLQIPIYYLSRTLDSTAYGFKPEVVSYGYMALEISKVIVAFVLLADMRLGLTGAILSVALAQIAQIAILLFFMRKKFHGSVDTRRIKKWLSLSWLPTYSGLASSGGLLFTLDATIVALITRSTIPVAIFQIASTVGAMVGYSSALAFALYPKLLGGGGRRESEASIKYVLMFGLPMAVGAMILAPEILFIFRSEYVVGENVLRVMSLGFLIIAITSISDNIILGKEKVDVYENAKFSDYRKSKLFLLPSVYSIQAVVYLSILATISIYAKTFSLEPSDIALYWSLAFLGTLIPTSIYRWRLARSILPFSFPFSRLARYALSSLIMAMVVLLTKGSIIFHEGISDYVVLLIPVVALGGIAYGASLLLIDREFRSFVFTTLKSLTSFR